MDDGVEVEGPAAYKEKVKAVFRRLHAEPVGIRVHDVIIRGNFKTRGSLIEEEVGDLLRSAGTVQGLVRASSHANALLRRLAVFESVSITLDTAPPGVPAAARGGAVVVLVAVRRRCSPSPSPSPLAVAAR